MHVILALVLMVGVFSYFSEPSRYEAQIERMMRALFPNAKSIQVRIKGSGGFAALRGEFDSVEITVVGAKAKSDALMQFIASDDGNRLNKGVTPSVTHIPKRAARDIGHIASVRMRFSDCELDGMPFIELTIGLSKACYDLQKLLNEHRIRLIDMSDGWFVFKLPSSFISSLVERQLIDNGLVQPKVKLHAQEVHVEASYQAWWLRIPFSADGELIAAPPCKVAVRLKSLKVLNVIPVPSSAVERLIGGLEFSLELAELKMPFEPQLVSVYATEEAVEFRGILRLPKAEQAEPKEAG